MPNITSIGAGIYTSLAYVTNTVVEGTPTAGEVSRDETGDEWRVEFETRTTPGAAGDNIPVAWAATANARAFGRIREFPNIGIPANIVNVPQYGQPSSSQVVGQSDPPNLDFTFNYVPSIHYFIDDLRASGETKLFRIRLSNGELVKSQGGTAANESGGTDGAGSADVQLPYEWQNGAGDDGSTIREFSDFYLFGSVASFEIVPALTDANQVNVSLTIQGQLSGPWSYANPTDVTTSLVYGKPPTA